MDASIHASSVFQGGLGMSRAYSSSQLEPYCMSIWDKSYRVRDISLSNVELINYLHAIDTDWLIDAIEMFHVGNVTRNVTPSLTGVTAPR